MASLKITELDAIGSVAADDLMLIVDESGDPTSCNVTVEALGTYIGNNYALLEGNAVGNINMSTHDLAMNTGEGTGGGNLYLDGGTLFGTIAGEGNAILYGDGSNGWAMEGAQVGFYGTTINMSSGGGSGGGSLNMDGGTINFPGIDGDYGVNGSGSTINTGSFNNERGADGGVSLVCAVGFELNWQAGYLSSSYNSGENLQNIDMGGSGFNMHGSNINMNAGGGDSGGNIDLEKGTLYLGSGAYIIDDLDGGINFIDSGGYTLNWNVWDNNGLQLNGANLVMNNASGTGGGNLYMDNGQIRSCSNIFSDAGTTSIAFAPQSDGDLDQEAYIFGGHLDVRNYNIYYAPTIYADGGETLYATQSWATLSHVLGSGNNASGTAINMNTGGGTGGGTLNMDGGPITNAGSISQTTQTLSDSSGTITWDVSQGPVADVELTGDDRTLVIQNAVSGATYTLLIVQAGFGSHTITTYPADFKWEGGSPPTLSTNNLDILTVIRYGNAGNYFCMLNKNFG